MTECRYISKLLPLFFVIIIFLRCNDSKPGAAISISLKAVNGLKYDKVKFSVKPGSEVLLTLTNVSDMPHNLLITKPGQRENVVKAALQLSQEGPSTNFIPDIESVLWSIPVISPGQTDSVRFTAPGREGIYPYVCTYPGHGLVMFGEMHVTQVDDTVEVSLLNDTTKVSAPPHPYQLTPPYLYHTFIDGVGPSAIAVHLPNNISYCWDADACRLQIAWKGGFIDMSDIWEGHFDASSKLLGDVFFIDKTNFPFSFNESATPPDVVYKGYRLIENYPQFHYTINDADVFELIRPKNDGFGLIREFSIPASKSVLWFYKNNNDESIDYTSSTGTFINDKLKLSPSQSKRFTITMTSYSLAFKKKNE